MFIKPEQAILMNSDILYASFTNQLFLIGLLAISTIKTVEHVKYIAELCFQNLLNFQCGICSRNLVYLIIDISIRPTSYLIFLISLVYY